MRVARGGPRRRGAGVAFRATPCYWTLSLVDELRSLLDKPFGPSDTRVLRCGETAPVGIFGGWVSTSDRVVKRFTASLVGGWGVEGSVEPEGWLQTVSLDVGIARYMVV